jgi:hypothetical protein
MIANEVLDLATSLRETVKFNGPSPDVQHFVAAILTARRTHGLRAACRAASISENCKSRVSGLAKRIAPHINARPTHQGQKPPRAVFGS